MKIISALVIIISLLLIPKLEVSAQLPAEDAATILETQPQTNNFAQCQFYRAGSGEPLAYKSPLLLSYFQEASKISSIPAPLLAAIARVESPSAANLTDDQVSSYKCATSQTAAKGFMQIQPPGTRGHDADAVSYGAALLNKKITDLSIQEDYCDIKTSIVLAAGFIFKKLEDFEYKNDRKWNPEWTNNKDVIYAVAKGYYGCLEYGGPDPLRCGGPHNYGEDLWNSLQSCQNPTLTTTPNIQTTPISNTSTFCTKVGNAKDEDKPAVCSTQPTTPSGGTPSVPSGPRPEAPPPEGDIQGAIQEKFGISMRGYDRQRLQWAWEKFWDVSNTKFIELVRGSIIQVTSTSNSHQAACPNPNTPAVHLGPFNDEYTFKQALMHELGHVIANCSTKKTAQWTQYLRAHVAEGGVSHYGRNAESCTGSDSVSEDFAEMIAFYLNPGIATTIVACNKAPEKVDLQNQFPLHYQVANTILGPY